MRLKTALRASLAVVFTLLATNPAKSQTDTTNNPLRFGFFAGPVISEGPIHAIIGTTLTNKNPISLATWIDPGDTTFTLTTTSGVRLWSHRSAAIHALIGAELAMIDRPLTTDETITYLLIASGAAATLKLFDDCSILLAASRSIPDKANRNMRFLVALHFNIGHRTAP